MGPWSQVGARASRSHVGGTATDSTNMGRMHRIIVVCVAAATAVSSLGVVSARSGSEALAVSRVEATPVPTPTPSPELSDAGGLVPNYCPGLDDPGGNAVVKASVPDPVPTDGTIAPPSVGVDAPLVRVGVRDGEMVVPRTAHEVAWLDGGSFPGPTNNAVLAGHHDWNGRLGSFDLDTPEAPRIMGPADVPSVTLITCGGVFNRRAGTHNQRIVVRAELVETPRNA